MPLAVALGRQCGVDVELPFALASQSPRQWHPAYGQWMFGDVGEEEARYWTSWATLLFSAAGVLNAAGSNTGSARIFEKGGLANLGNGVVTDAKAIGQLASSLRAKYTAWRRQWEGPSIRSGVGQSAIREQSVVSQIQNDMLNGKYRFESTEGRIGGWRDGGQYFISEGHHRMRAAMNIFKETGDPTFVNKLLQNGLWAPGPPNMVAPLP